MDKTIDNFSKSPLIIASKKAKWIFDGFEMQTPSTTVLLAQILSALVHGHRSFQALPASTDLRFSKIERAPQKSQLSKLKAAFSKEKPLFAMGQSCLTENVYSEHNGKVSIICGDSVSLKNVTFKGGGNKNLVVICNGASLENIEITLDGLGLVIIGADSTLKRCNIHTNSNNGDDCTLYKTILTFPNEAISDATLDSILKRKRAPIGFTQNSNTRVKKDSFNIADSFSLALSGQYSHELRKAEDTKQFREKLIGKDGLVFNIKSIYNSCFSIPRGAESSNEVRVAILMMQRNETSLLKPWVSYYQRLFGKENLFIFDNGSTDPQVIEYLHTLRDNEDFYIDFSFQSSADFKRKGIIFKRFIEELQHLDYYDIFIPIDCDEFLGFKNGADSFTLQREKIFEHLGSLKFTKSALKIRSFFNNFPSSSSFFYAQSGEKTLFTANTIYKLDRGYHKGETINGKETTTQLTFLHFHNKPLDELKQHSYNKLKPFFDVDNNEVVKELIENKNRLAKNLIESNEGYESRFSDKDKIYSSELEKLLEELDSPVKM